MSFDPVSPVPITALGATPQKLFGNSGLLELALFDNANAATVYLQVFDGTGLPTVGTTKPIFSIPIPPNGGGLQPRARIPFKTGLAIACTTTPQGAVAPSTAINGTIGVSGITVGANVYSPGATS